MTACPWCGTAVQDYHAQEPDLEPRPGALSICCYCLGLGIFLRTAEGMKIRRANRAEQQSLMSRTDVQEALDILARHLGHPIDEAIDAWRKHAQAEATEETEDAEHPVEHQQRDDRETDVDHPRQEPETEGE